MEMKWRRKSKKYKYLVYRFKHKGENNKQINEIVKRAIIATKKTREIMFDYLVKRDDPWSRIMGMGRIGLNTTSGY